MSANPYLDFDLRLRAEGDGFVAEVTQSPAGGARQAFTLPFNDDQLENYLLKIGQRVSGVRRADTPESRAAREFGAKLFEAVFQGDLLARFRASTEEARRREAGLRVRLRLDEAPALADLPWEYLYQPAQRQFLALSKDTPIVRCLDLAEVKKPLAVQPPLRALVMVATPTDQDELDVQREVAKLREAVQDLEARGLLVLDVLPAATLDALQRQLRRADHHIFHFIGHGAFNPATQEGVLIFEDERRKSHLVSGHDLGLYLRDEPTLRLALLNACEGARAGRSDPFAGAAQGLFLKGVPAVIAMQFAVSDQAAITFAHGFYSALADGLPVDAALGEARKSVFARGNGVEWGTPVLYLGAPDGRIFDVDTSGVETTAARLARLLAEAGAAAQAGDWAGVATQASAVLALEPQDEAAAGLLARAQAALGAEAKFNEGVAHAEAGRWAEAAAAWEAVERARPGFRDTAARLRRARQKLADLQKGPPKVGVVEPSRPPDNGVPPPPRKKGGGVLLAVAALALLGMGAAVFAFLQDRNGGKVAYDPATNAAPPRPAPPAAADGWRVLDERDDREHGPVDLAELQQWIRERRVTDTTRVRRETDTTWRTAADVSELAALLPVKTRPEPEPAPPEPEPPGADAGGWYFRDAKGAVDGPVSLGAILAMISAGQITDGSWVRPPGDKDFEFAGKVSALSAALRAAQADEPPRENPLIEREPAGPAAAGFKPEGWWRLTMSETVRLTGIRHQFEGQIVFLPAAFGGAGEGNYIYSGQFTGGLFAGNPFQFQGPWYWDPRTHRLELRHGMPDGSINIIQVTVSGGGDGFTAEGGSAWSSYTMQLRRAAGPDAGALDDAERLRRFIEQFGR